MAAGGTSIAPYLITASSTLAGVVITLIVSEIRERRRAREERQRERDRVIEDRWKWLRQERRQAYAALVSLGFQAAATLLEAASRLHDRKDPDGALELWSRLDELEDAIYAKVADVQLVGSEAVLTKAYALRRSARRTASLLSQSVDAAREHQSDDDAADDGLSPRIRRLYGATHDLVEAATADLRVSLDASEEAGPVTSARGADASGDEEAAAQAPPNSPSAAADR
ncbi:hypothetical protein [Streptomyces gilvus]|uniref:hypothetical protein n=1 Tax=Streptomyces gilvus TaxID=2920937 RepID=UPI001F0DA2AF|nr:hypothetical protein [Streptomyces sp. CME 23]MCH5677915.1 hypothetical protein [Streptomyces sp. CME 23]